MVIFHSYVKFPKGKLCWASTLPDLRIVLCSLRHLGWLRYLDPPEKTTSHGATWRIPRRFSCGAPAIKPLTIREWDHPGIRDQSMIKNQAYYNQVLVAIRGPPVPVPCCLFQPGSMRLPAREGGVHHAPAFALQEAGHGVLRIGAEFRRPLDDLQSYRISSGYDQLE